jgi:hypothetical protein
VEWILGRQLPWPERLAGTPPVYALWAS